LVATLVLLVNAFGPPDPRASSLVTLHAAFGCRMKLKQTKNPFFIIEQEAHWFLISMNRPSAQFQISKYQGTVPGTPLFLRPTIRQGSLGSWLSIESRLF
jgi:hypothetical protein